MKREDLIPFAKFIMDMVNYHRLMGTKPEALADAYLASLSPAAEEESLTVEPMTAEEILDDTMRCTISDDDDLDNPENFYFKYNDVLEAMRRYASKPTVAEREVSDEEIEREFPTDLLVICKQQSILPRFDADQGEYLGVIRDSNQDKQLGAKWMRELIKGGK